MTTQDRAMGAGGVSAPALPKTYASRIVMAHLGPVVAQLQREGADE